MGVVGFAIFWIMIGVAVLLVMACVRLGANALHLLDPAGTIRQKKAAQKDLRTTTVFRYAAGNNEGSIVQFKRHRAQVLTPREIANATQRREWAEFLLLIFMAQATLTCLLGIAVVDQGLMSDRLMAYSGMVLGTLTACWGIYNTRYRKEFMTELAKLSVEEGATLLEDAQPENTEKETANASR
jgi:hypothetical protein